MTSRSKKYIGVILAGAQVKAQGPPDPEDGSVAALLLRLRDPATGAALPDDLLAGEFGVFFTAGIESAGHAITWTLCGPGLC